jgi:hypothetical protein
VVFPFLWHWDPNGPGLENPPNFSSTFYDILRTVRKNSSEVATKLKRCHAELILAKGRTVYELWEKHLFYFLN